MAKTKYQELAMEYAKDYLERLLDLEDVLGHQVDMRLSQLVEQKVKEYMESINQNQ